VPYRRSPLSGGGGNLNPGFVGRKDAAPFYGISPPKPCILLPQNTVGAPPLAITKTQKDTLPGALLRFGGARRTASEHLSALSSR